MILISSNLVFLHAPGHRTQEKKRRQEDIFINACFALLFFLGFFSPRKFRQDKYPVFKSDLPLLKDIYGCSSLDLKKNISTGIKYFAGLEPQSLF